MRHIKDPKFKPLFDTLPADVRAVANRNFALLKSDPKHPSLHFKCIRGDLWSVRVGRRYRAVAVKGDDRFQWFWIGTHADYDALIRRS